MDASLEIKGHLVKRCNRRLTELLLLLPLHAIVAALYTASASGYAPLVAVSGQLEPPKDSANPARPASAGSPVLDLASLAARGSNRTFLSALISWRINNAVRDGTRPTDRQTDGGTTARRARGKMVDGRPAVRRRRMAVAERRSSASPTPSYSSHAAGFVQFRPGCQTGSPAVGDRWRSRDRPTQLAPSSVYTDSITVAAAAAAAATGQYISRRQPRRHCTTRSRLIRRGSLIAGRPKQGDVGGQWSMRRVAPGGVFRISYRNDKCQDWVLLACVFRTRNSHTVAEDCDSYNKNILKYYFEVDLIQIIIMTCISYDRPITSQ